MLALARTGGVTRVLKGRLSFVLLGPALLGVGLVVTLLVAGSAFASKAGSQLGRGAQGVTDRPETTDAYQYLTPSSTTGSCSAPSNGGVTTVGCRFVLDLMVNAGSNADSAAQQVNITFTNAILQNAWVPVIGTSCVLTDVITQDLQHYDMITQNETCDGPGHCVFRGRVADPGTIAYASGDFSGPPEGISGVFRVARIGLCATAPGHAVLHWQFDPNDFDRDTVIVNMNNEPIQTPALFTDYAFDIVPPARTVPLIIGHVNWQGAPAQPDPRQQQAVTLTLKSGATEVDFPLQNTDSYGFFTDTLPALAPGTHNWRVKGPKSLATAGTIALTGEGVTNLEAGLLRAGDANDDNVVNIGDFAIMRATFGKMLGQAGYDGRGDFNNDEVVNVTDVSLHKNNNGIGGAPPIGP